MRLNDAINKIAFISDYPPRKCGIATFTQDLRNALSSQYPHSDAFIISVNDIKEGYSYPPEVRFDIQQNDISTYRNAADYLNFNPADIVSVQHEFGIFGGPAGNYLLTILREIKIPVVTTFHTVLKNPDADQLKVMRELIRLSARYVVMSETGKEFLEKIYNADPLRIDIIPHGIPDMPFVDPNFYKDQFGVEGKNVILTFGLISPGKGIENVLKALPKVISKYPNTVYIILGATHPNLLRQQGESYRLSLERLANDLGINKNVIFYNRFVSLDELKEFIGAADIYITPYLNEAQITSGTLSYAFGCGKAVISTPYWHAKELLSDNRGILVPFNDPDAIAEAIELLISNETLRHSMRKRAYIIGREMIWSNVAHLYMESFIKARKSRLSFTKHRMVIKTLDEENLNLPKVKTDYLKKLTDNTGIIQHAKYSIPNYKDGYCLDDNARALILTVLLENTQFYSEEIKSLQETYASFINYAFDEENKFFKNKLSFERKWLEEKGSEDSNGRAIWALGTVINRSKNQQLQNWAADVFIRALDGVEEFISTRAWAFVLLGISEYLSKFGGDRIANQIRDELEKKLINIYKIVSSEDWKWFENYLTYSNAKLSLGLIASSMISGNQEALSIGLDSLHWLCKIQKSSTGNFAPIGNDGFYTRGQKRALYDQQPIEAFSTVAATLKAYEATKDIEWLKEARLAFEWFLGRNDNQVSLIEHNSGACRDGLHIDRANSNMGAESTLAYLLSLTLMYLYSEAYSISENNFEKTEVEKISVVTN
ncbi:Glycosyltransferase [Ignavibacterium album JCM 16511]|uniref:Glycosyltransferase n=1 Tax=Ignavibacterium album (strain DSM 19864 / JCM 16511 / NBRC 101810 / Mat9-16) TaxID=945713 RepID=I0AHH2_IGNAJ|nr:glycosyltransferase family 4 protein [Ignavibacterium album]AFH48429.1 Glycosyltransferase [Ignavibacterium album JCM 16511]